METLQVPKSYKNYADFKRKVLEQAKNDINKFTDIEVSYTEKKKVRKVISVTFSIKKNWNDLKSFIAWIRELYTNQPLYEGKDGRMLKCSEKGLLYYADDVMEWLDEKTAQKAWEWLFEHREKLYCFQPNLLDFAEPTDTPKAPKQGKQGDKIAIDDLKIETEKSRDFVKFKNYHIGKNTNPKSLKQWTALFENWCLNAEDFKEEREAKGSLEKNFYDAVLVDREVRKILEAKGLQAEEILEGVLEVEEVEFFSATPPPNSKYRGERILFRFKDRALNQKLLEPYYSRNEEPNLTQIEENNYDEN
jgi:hypothetical protein